MLEYHDADWGSEEEEEGEWADEYVEGAKEDLRAFFHERGAQVFYLKQLQVLFERKYFHWVTYRAVNALLDDGFLRAEVVPLGERTVVKFLARRRHRYYRRQIANSLTVIRAYSDPEIAMGCGEQADVLFFNALASRGFAPAGQDTNEYQGGKWTESDHDLDFIVERDGVGYGCEVKNTWGYIRRDELRIKLRICEYLGVRPLFIMRASPKTYNKEIIDVGGFALIFEAQIYPFGQSALVGRIKGELGLPADCPRAVPAGIIQRFVGWHERKERTGRAN